ncbi:hypothetical protein ACQGAO_00200 [Rhodococcus sp. 1.20]
MAIHRYRLVGALVAAALALSVATACGSSQEDPGTGTGAAVDTSAAPQQVTWRATAVSLSLSPLSTDRRAFRRRSRSDTAEHPRGW